MQSAPIDQNERIGRGVFSESLAGRLRERRSPKWVSIRSLFAPPQDRTTVSADRLDRADCTALTKFHSQNAANRAQQSKFHGWFACKASVYICRGGTVQQSAEAGNPSHCDVNAKLATREDVANFLRAIPMEERWKERCE